MRNPKLTTVAVFLIIGFVAAQFPAATPLETAERRIRRQMKATRIPGMSVTVMQNGRIVGSKRFGSADLEHNVGVTQNTRFRLASVSKVVTAAAVARLVDRGKPDLDSPLSEYIDGLPEAIEKQ